MNATLRKYLLIAFVLYMPFQSFAWGTLGHRIVGEIAQKHLSKKALKQVRKILGNESIAMSSNWADFIKSDSSYRYLSTWHYVNFDSGMNYTQLVAYLDKDTSVNAYTRINFLANELRKENLPHDKQVFYLRLLIHFVGDIHQPLHAARNGLVGGNNIRVSWFNENSNLHRVWDSHLIDHQQLSYTEYVNAINFVTPEKKKVWQRQPLSEWVYESFLLSEQIVQDIKQPTPRLGYDYDFKYNQILNQQLLKGGIHLAGLLNDIFG